MIQRAIKIKNSWNCYAWSTNTREHSCCRNCRSLTTAARTQRSGGSCCYVSTTKLPHFGPCKSTFKRRVTCADAAAASSRRYTRASLLVYIMRNYPESDRNDRLLFKFRSTGWPSSGGGRWVPVKEGLRKIPIDGQPRRPRRFKNSGFTSSRAIACRVGWMKTCRRWKRYRWSSAHTLTNGGFFAVI